MTNHIVCLAGPSDKYQPKVAPRDKVLLVPFDVPGHEDAIRTSVPDVLSTYGLVPTVAADDLLRASIAAYTGDVRIWRGDGYDRWTRDLALHLPVRASLLWDTAAPQLERLLAFLTGDHWKVLTRPAPEESTARRQGGQKPSISLESKSVSLFSGGLDSYIGALDVLGDGKQVVLVGHHAAGQGPTSTAQRDAIAVLRTIYTEDQAPFLQFWLSPPKGTSRASETTTRGRSILFLSLGIAVASALGAERLLVPENGVISLNVPLTPPRSGSLSTRTTHPHLIALLRRLLLDLDIHVTVDLPYRFQTKGEMLSACVDQHAVTESLPATMSCGRPGVGRFIKGGSSNQHCGYCVPCLIRRAAIASWGADPTRYGWRDLRTQLSATRGADLRALRLALDRYVRQQPGLADLLTAGPLPGTPDERAAYVDVYRRGISELGKFVSQFA